MPNTSKLDYLFLGHEKTCLSFTYGKGFSLIVFSLLEFPWPPGVHHSVNTHLDCRQCNCEKQHVKNLIFKYYLLYFIKGGSGAALSLEGKPLILEQMWLILETNFA